MTPPYATVMAHSSVDGKAIWKEPFYLPNMDELLERGVVIHDCDGDGWNDLLIGSRFHGAVCALAVHVFSIY